jgi:ketosteroid isomerase-like protein
MKPIYYAALSAAAVATFLAQRSRSTSQGSGTTEQEIANVMSQVREAQLNGDASTLERLFPDDYTFINPFGELMTKGEVVSEVQSGDLKFQSWEMKDRRLRVFGNAAISTGLVNLRAQRYGHDISGEYRGTWFWVKNRGRWEPIAGQATRLQHEMAGATPTVTTRSASKPVTRS